MLFKARILRDYHFDWLTDEEKNELGSVVEPGTVVEVLAQYPADESGEGFICYIHNDMGWVTFDGDWEVAFE